MRTFMFALSLGASLALASTDAAASITPSIMSVTPDVPRTKQEKQAVIQDFIDSTTACIAQVVRKHPHYLTHDVTVLIVEAFNPCSEPASAMVHQHDALYGRGSGNAFFMGPYLDYLPHQVQQFEDK